MPPPHTETLLSDKILSFLEEWGIENKIFFIILDNASNNDNCQDFIKKKLNEGGLLYLFSCVLWCSYIESYCSRRIESNR